MIFKYIKCLIDRDNPARSHVAYTGFVIVILCLLALILGISSIFIVKSLVSELTATLAALVSLVGYNVSKSKRVLENVTEEQK